MVKREALKPWILQGFRASPFGASNVTRTHDLLITNVGRAVGVLVFGAFRSFYVGYTETYKPVVSTQYIRSYSRLGQRLGQLCAPCKELERTVNSDSFYKLKICAAIFNEKRFSRSHPKPFYATRKHTEFNAHSFPLYISAYAQAVPA